jgi:hypothetical protein
MGMAMRLVRCGGGVAVAFLVAGCAAPVEVWPPEWHPANAGATEGTARVRLTALEDADPVEEARAGVVPPNAGPGEGGGHAHGHGEDHAGHGGEPATGPVTYTCPMHAEVTSDTPGKCPKCGMALKPVPSGGER